MFNGEIALERGRWATEASPCAAGAFARHGVPVPLHTERFGLLPVPAVNVAPSVGWARAPPTLWANEHPYNMRWRRTVPGGSMGWDLIEVEAYNVDNWGRALAWCDGTLMTVPYRGAMELVLDGERGVRHFQAEGGRWHKDPVTGTAAMDEGAPVRP